MRVSPASTSDAVAVATSVGVFSTAVKVPLIESITGASLALVSDTEMFCASWAPNASVTTT